MQNFVERPRVLFDPGRILSARPSVSIVNIQRRRRASWYRSSEDFKSTYRCISLDLDTRLDLPNRILWCVH